MSAERGVASHWDEVIVSTLPGGPDASALQGFFDVLGEKSLAQLGVLCLDH
jgi:hypothetical protein